MSVILQEARTLADYMLTCNIQSQTQYFQKRPTYNHLGALLTDIVLQSGLNYNTVVKPRVFRVLREFSYASTLPLLKSIVNVYGTSYLLNWKNSTKTRRFEQILDFCLCHQIEDESDLRIFLTKGNNKDKFLQINGVGPKTIDYALKLMGVECVAVDRHIYSFVKEAGINRSDYYDVKMIVEYAADLLSLSRTGVDSFIWTSMNKSQNSQVSLSF